MTLTSIKDSKTSMNDGKKRPVEALIIGIIEKRELDRKFNGHTEMIDERQSITRSLIKNLFLCSNQQQVDRVVIEAQKCTESYRANWGEDGTDFSLRIRNAELQVRKLIESGFDLKQINPTVHPVIVKTIHAEAVADSWGHLTDKFIKGYRLSVV